MPREILGFLCRVCRRHYLTGQVGDARIGVQQHVHRRLRKPLFVDEEFAARGQQPVDDEQLEDFVPRHVAGVGGQGVAPEGVQVEVFPEFSDGPTVAEAARRLHGEGRELDLDHIGIVGGGLVAIGEEAQWAALTVLVQDVNGVLPGLELGGVEFAQMEHLALDDALAADAPAFADRVVDVGLAVFGAGAAFEKHAGSLPRARVRPAKGWVGPQAFGAKCLLSLNNLCVKKSENWQNVRKLG